MTGSSPATGLARVIQAYPVMLYMKAGTGYPQTGFADRSVRQTGADVDLFSDGRLRLG